MFTLLKEMNIFKLESFENIEAKEEFAPAGGISPLSQCFQMSSSAADVNTRIYGVKG